MPMHASISYAAAQKSNVNWWVQGSCFKTSRHCCWIRGRSRTRRTCSWSGTRGRASPSSPVNFSTTSSSVAPPCLRYLPLSSVMHRSLFVSLPPINACRPSVSWDMSAVGPPFFRLFLHWRMRIDWQAEPRLPFHHCHYRNLLNPFWPLESLFCSGRGAYLDRIATPSQLAMLSCTRLWVAVSLPLSCSWFLHSRICSCGGGVGPVDTDIAPRSPLRCELVKALPLFDGPRYSIFLLPVPFLSCLDLVGIIAVEEWNSDKGLVLHLFCLKSQSMGGWKQWHFASFRW